MAELAVNQSKGRLLLRFHLLLMPSVPDQTDRHENHPDKHKDKAAGRCQLWSHRQRERLMTHFGPSIRWYIFSNLPAAPLVQRFDSPPPKDKRAKAKETKEKWIERPPPASPGQNEGNQGGEHPNEKKRLNPHNQETSSKETPLRNDYKAVRIPSIK